MKTFKEFVNEENDWKTNLQKDLKKEFGYNFEITERTNKKTPAPETSSPFVSTVTISCKDIKAKNINKGKLEVIVKKWTDLDPYDFSKDCEWIFEAIVNEGTVAIGSYLRLWYLNRSASYEEFEKFVKKELGDYIPPHVAWGLSKFDDMKAFKEYLEK